MDLPRPPARSKLLRQFKQAMILPAVCSLIVGCATAPPLTETSEASAATTAAAAPVAEASKFAGNWVLNEELSRWDAMKTKSSPGTLSVVEKSTGFEVVHRQQGTNALLVGDQHPVHVNFKSFTFDGSPTLNVPPKLGIPTTIKLISRTPDRMVLESKMNLKHMPAESVVWELLPDGRLSIIETDQQGQRSSTEIYDRAK